MTKSELLRKTIMFIPSIAVAFFVFMLLGSVNTGFNFPKFFQNAFSNQNISILINSLPLLFGSLILSMIFGLLLSLPNHSSTMDMWFSLLHGLFLSMPIFLFLLIIILFFSDFLKLIPHKGIFDVRSLIAPVVSVSLVFALYISFKTRFYKRIKQEQIKSNFKKTSFFYFKTLSSEIGIFISMLIVTEFFFFSNGIGSYIGSNIQKGKIENLSILFLYLSLIFILLKYIFSLIAFLLYNKKKDNEI